MRNGMSETDRKKKRRRRRIQVVIVYVAIAVGLAWFFESQATTTIIFVRHAEKAQTPPEDPGLSPAGERRRAELTRQLVDADVVAGIDAIYSTPYKRTVQTAQPLAEALNLPINRYDPDDNEAVLDRILKEHKGKIILVVGHSDTTMCAKRDGRCRAVPGRRAPLWRLCYASRRQPAAIASRTWTGATDCK